MTIRAVFQFKPKLSYFLVSLFAITLLTHCSEDDDPQVEVVTEAPAYIVQNTVQAPDAPRTIFLNVLSDLTDEIDLADAFEFNGNSRVRVFNGKVYIFDSERGLIIRHSINENNVLVEEDRFSISQLGASAFTGIIAFVNDEYALVQPTGLGQFVIWNPTTMEVRNTIDFPADSPDSFTISNIGTVSVSPDGKIFLGVAGFSASAPPNNTPGARVLIIDPVTSSVDVVFNESIAAGTEGAFDGEGNYYFSANGYFGFASYFGFPAEAAQSMTRINRGELSFDSEFNIPATSIGGLGRPQSTTFEIIGNEFLIGVIDLSDDDLRALVNPLDLLVNAPIKLLRGNLENWEAAVEVPFSDGNKTLTEFFVVDGSFYGVAREISLDGTVGTDSDIYRFTESNTLEKLTTGVGWVEYIERVR